MSGTWIRTVFAGMAAALIGFLAIQLGKSYYIRLPATGTSAPPARLAFSGAPIDARTNCRTSPLRIRPAARLRHAVSDDDFLTSLCAALPYWTPPTMPSVIHELRLWGPRAVFKKDMFGVDRTGARLTEILCDDAACKRYTTQIGSDWLMDSPYGIRVVPIGSDDSVGSRGETHFGKVMQVLGETGTPSTTRVTTASGRVGTVADILGDTLMRYSPTVEQPFVACALAYWLPPQTHWQNEFGDRYAFDDLMRFLLAAPIGSGSCGGCHTPYAVVTILRVDEREPVLSPQVRESANAWLVQLLRRLELKWQQDGRLDRSWADSHVEYLYGNDVLDRITITGHHLEWIALLPDSIHVDPEIVRRIVLGLRRDLDALPPLRAQSFKTLFPLSHAARALALIRGVDAYEFWLSAWQAGVLERLEEGLRPRKERLTTAELTRFPIP